MIKPQSIAAISLAFILAVLAVNYDLFFGRSFQQSSQGLAAQVVASPVSQPDATKDSVADSGAKNGPQFVGKRVCGECHKDNHKLHSQHGHASTFFETADTKLPDVFEGESFDAGDDYGVYTYRKDESGNLIAQLKDDDDAGPLPLQYVLGSGENAQTFLTLSTDTDGTTKAIEHRVTCYRDDRLAITVGHEEMSPRSTAEKFGATVEGLPLERCVYCHTTTFRFDAGRVTDLIANVDCEKCHGPGSEHVAQARASSTPPPFSVGLSTWDAESEIQLCGDCHRLPRSISQSELRDYPDKLTRFQPVGMLRSECYLESGDTMRCTTCHDPHASVHGGGDKIDHVKNCVKCHDDAQSKHVICPVSPSTDCIECHMPKVDQGQGILFHDHWIRVHQD